MTNFTENFSLEYTVIDFVLQREIKRCCFSNLMRKKNGCESNEFLPYITSSLSISVIYINVVQTMRNKSFSR